MTHPTDAPELVALVKARKHVIETVDSYNAKRDAVNKKRENGDWSEGLEREYRAICDAKSAFARAAVVFTDAALAAFKETTK